MNCVVDDYLKFVNNFLYNYYKMLLAGKYSKKIIMPFVEKYIDVRYYNNSIYETGSSIDKINKELKLVAKELIKQDISKEEEIKIIFSLFGYVLYFDDCVEYKSINSLLKSLYEDDNIEIYNKDLDKDEFKNFIKDFIDQKNKFFKLFETNKFSISKKRIAKKTYKVDIDQHCNITSLYSDYAINKAYNSEVVTENKMYLLYILMTSKILKDVIELDLNNNYIIDFPVSLFNKEIKINKYLKAIDNEIIKQKLHLHFTYKDYLNYKDKINSFIKEGFNVSVTLDDTFVDDFKGLIRFSYVFVYEKYEYYDTIIDDRDKVNANIVTL